MLVKFTAFVAFMRHSGWSCLWCSEYLLRVWGIGVGPLSRFYSVSSVYGAVGLDVCGILELFCDIYGALVLYVWHLCGV